jgi:Ca2+-binding RTX toxin-like protein
VSVNGQPATLTATASAIRLNNAACGGATVANTDSVAVTGSDFNDVVTLTNDFAPGATPEGGAGEIEVSVSLGGGNDTFKASLGGGDDVAVFTSSGIDLFGDGDEDIELDAESVEHVNVMGGPGADILDGALYPDALSLHGNAGDDVVIGGLVQDHLYGEDGDDTIEGGGGGDRLFGGPGDDVEDGGDGHDQFRQQSAADGADTMIGGAGQDRAFYDKRSVGVTVTLGDGQANDGAAGEGDSIAVDVEHVMGGGGDDVLIGSDVRNTLEGNGGDDFLQGLLGRDVLDCGTGTDEAVGGPDTHADFLRPNCETVTE